MSGKTLKILSLVVTILGFGITLSEKFIKKKEIDDEIAKKVAEAFSKGAGS